MAATEVRLETEKIKVATVQDEKLFSNPMVRLDRNAAKRQLDRGRRQRSQAKLIEAFREGEDDDLEGSVGVSPREGE